MYVTDVPVHERLTDATVSELDRLARERHNAGLLAHIRATRPKSHPYYPLSNHEYTTA